MSNARKRLMAYFPESTSFSENIRTAAVPKEKQPLLTETAFYLNAVCQAQSERSLNEIQSFLKQTETEMGRIRGSEAKGQVSIDLDLVEWNEEVLRPKDANQAYYQVCIENLRNL